MQVMRQLLHIGTPGSRPSQRSAVRGFRSCLPRKARQQSATDRGSFVGFHFLSDCEGHFFLWCDAVKVGRNILKFRHNTLLPSSTLTLKTRAVGFSSMLIHPPDNTASHTKWQMSFDGISTPETLRKFMHHYHTFLHPQIHETSLYTLETWKVHVDIVRVKKKSMWRSLQMKIYYVYPSPFSAQMHEVWTEFQTRDKKPWRTPR